MVGLKTQATQVARRAVKGAAALALHCSGAREFLSAVQRRAVGGRRVLILSYHRVVQDFAQEVERGGLHTLNVGQKTFRRHLEVLLAVQKPVIGARPTNFERAPPEHSSLSAHG
jgi:hypothetical protein